MSTPWNSGSPVPLAHNPTPTLDPNYTLITVPSGSGYSGTAYTTLDDNTFPFNGFWIHQNAFNNSRWIQPEDGTLRHHEAGTYIYRTIFTMSDGSNPLDPTTAQIQFRVAVDNNLTDVLINSNSTGITYDQYAGFSGTQTINANFVSGANTLDFVVSNNPGTQSPSGIRVEILSATAALAALPEPGALPLFVFGALGLAGVVRYRRKP